MRTLWICLLPGMLWAAGPSHSALNAITPEAGRSILAYLAADSLKGRNTPSPELDRCAEFLAERFRAFGLQPVNGSYFQSVPINRIHLGDSNRVTLRGQDGVQTKLAIKKDFVPFEITADSEVCGDVVFVGYGISAPESNYDDYAGIDVAGRIVLALKGGPNEQKPDSPFSSQKRSPAVTLKEKVKCAMDHGAVGFMLVTNPLRSSLLKPTGFPWPSLSKSFPADALPVSLGKTEGKKIPCIQIGEAALKTLFGSVEACKALAQRIDSLGQPHSQSLAHQAVLRTSVVMETQCARNVVAQLPGSQDGEKKEWLVVGAHYDHVGIRQNTPAGQDSIHNGADDNASGTAAMMLVAAAFSQEKKRPKRSVLFMAFAGEERGFFGSKTYVVDPLVPLESTVAMINLDMVGRNRVDSLTVFGRHNAPELWTVVEKENRHIGFKLSAGAVKESGGSDHEPFNEQKIPTLFFHTGLHPDYHQVSDQAEKINYGKLALAAKLAYRTVHRLAHSTFRPVLHETHTP